MMHLRQDKQLSLTHLWMIKSVHFELGYSRKICTPRRMGSFFNPTSHLDFLKHKIPPAPVWISKTKDAPACLDFQEKIITLKFNLFLIENMHNHV